MRIVFIPGEECKFNDFVECAKRDRCEKCGWNPEVFKKRIEKIRQREESKDE